MNYRGIRPVARCHAMALYKIDAVKTWDVIISGAGIIGVSLAMELCERGAEVLVLDRTEPGKEASSAAAGMLSGADPETHVPLWPLTRRSAELYPQFVEKLERLSGTKVDFRRGAIALFPTGTETPPEHAVLPSSELKKLEPALRAGDYSAALAAQENSVDPDLLMQAALVAARAVGIEVRGHTAVQQMRSSGSQIEVLAGEEHFQA